MKKFATFLGMLTALCLCACGASGFAVELSFRGCDAVPFTARLYGADGWDIGSAELKEGKNVLPLTSFCYLQCTFPQEYDCPVVYLDGKPAALTVSPAEYSEEEGGYLHLYTVFLQGAAPGTKYRLQICRNQEEGGFCKTDDFRGTSAALALSDGDYTLDLFAGNEIVYDGAFTLSKSSPRFCVLDLTKE